MRDHPRTQAMPRITVRRRLALAGLCLAPLASLDAQQPLDPPARERADLGGEGDLARLLVDGLAQ